MTKRAAGVHASAECFSGVNALRALFSCVVALLAFNYAAFGATNTFEMGTSWNTGVDWSSGSVPAATDALLISQAAYGGVLPDMTLDNSFTVQTLSFDTGTDNFSIDANVSGTTVQTLTFNGGTNALGGAAMVGSVPGTSVTKASEHIGYT